VIRVASRWAPPALAVAIVAGTGLAALAADRPHLTRDGGFGVVAPADGAKVGDGFLLAWTAGKHASQRFAVFVDAQAPRPGFAAVAGPNTLIVRGTALRLTLGPRAGGSPSARHWHQIVVVPLDDNDYRLGEDAVVVHVRDSA
jgi:hypothetical protein